MDAGTLPPFEIARGELLLSTDPARLDLDRVHAWLAGAYWSRGIPRATLERACAGSLAFSLHERGRQVGVARVISDGATFAYLCDVFVEPAARGRGLATWMLQGVRAHPSLQGLRRWLLVTRDAHALYRGLGFGAVAAPANWMESVAPDPRGSPGVAP